MKHPVVILILVMTFNATNAFAADKALRAHTLFIGTEEPELGRKVLMVLALLENRSDRPWIVVAEDFAQNMRLGIDRRELPPSDLPGGWGVGTTGPLPPDPETLPHITVDPGRVFGAVCSERPPQGFHASDFTNPRIWLQTRLALRLRSDPGTFLPRTRNLGLSRLTGELTSLDPSPQWKWKPVESDTRFRRMPDGSMRPVIEWVGQEDTLAASAIRIDDDENNQARIMVFVKNLTPQNYHIVHDDLASKYMAIHPDEPPATKDRANVPEARYLTLNPWQVAGSIVVIKDHLVWPQDTPRPRIAIDLRMRKEGEDTFENVRLLADLYRIVRPTR